MAATIKLDDKTGTVLAASLGVDYGAYRKAYEQDLARHTAFFNKITRTLKDNGVTSPVLKEADHKKLASSPNAAKLIAELEDMRSTVSMAYMAYDARKCRTEEETAREKLFDQAAGRCGARIKDIGLQMQALRNELERLGEQKKALVDQIHKATEKESEKFYDALGVMRKQVSALGTACNRYDFRATQRYLKK